MFTVSSTSRRISRFNHFLRAVKRNTFHLKKKQDYNKKNHYNNNVDHYNNKSVQFSPYTVTVSAFNFLCKYCIITLFNQRGTWEVKKKNTNVWPDFSHMCLFD